jgi:hypothetical protein
MRLGAMKICLVSIPGIRSGLPVLAQLAPGVYFLKNNNVDTVRPLSGSKIALICT